MNKAAHDYVANHIEEVKAELRRAYDLALQDPQESYWIMAGDDSVWTRELHRFGWDERLGAEPLTGYGISILHAPWLNDDDAMKMFSCSPEDLPTKKDEYIRTHHDEVEASFDADIRRFLAT